LDHNPKQWVGLETHDGMSKKKKKKLTAIKKISLPLINGEAKLEKRFIFTHILQDNN